MVTQSSGDTAHVTGGLLPRWALPLFDASGPYSWTPPNPWQLGVDRIFGSLADSLGLATPRAVFDNLRALTEAEIELGLATVELMTVIGSAYPKAARQAVERLAATRKKGESVDSALELARVWLRSVDKAMHTQMQSDAGVQATARMVKVQSELRLRIEALVGIATNSVGLPTRRDLDEAYREIQQLKREVRRLRRTIAADPGRFTETIPAADERPRSNGATVPGAGSAEEKA